MIDAEKYQPFKSGYILLQGLLLALFCAYGLRLWYLQIHKGEQYALKAKENRLQQQLIYAPRGLIRDRDGVLLAKNEPAYALALVREDSPDIDKALQQVSKWTEVPLQEVEEEFKRGKQRVKPFEPQILVPNLEFELLARIEANTIYWPGLKIVTRPRRYYPQGPLLAHVLGYVAQASEQELNANPKLRLGDNVGKQGIEYVLDERLRGKKGLKQLEVDAQGRNLKEDLIRAPSAGESLTLSIDLDLQRLASQQLKDQAGAIVVLNPHSGKLLALVSKPSYKNNEFVQGISTKKWKKLISNSRDPLQNRAIQSAYPPGSVFKLVMAISGLTEEKIKTLGKVYCSGKYRLGRRVFRCWKKHGHGWMNFKQAVIQSCDVYFYNLGKELGVEVINDYAVKCGFNQKTNIDLPHEKKGLIPDREWKRKRFGQRWQGGETINMSIGQGYTLVTPLQVGRFVSALVNGGTLLKPSLLLDEKPVEQGTLPVAEEDRKRIIKAMVGTVEEPHGTAWRLRMKGAVIGGKTGTAQVVKLMKEHEDKETEEIP